MRPGRGQAGEHVGVLRASSRPLCSASVVPSGPGRTPGLAGGVRPALGPPSARITHGAKLQARKEQEPVGEFLVLPWTCSAALWGQGAERSHTGLGPRVLPCPGARCGWRKPRGSKGARKPELGDLEVLDTNGETEASHLHGAGSLTQFLPAVCGASLPSGKGLPLLPPSAPARDRVTWP